MNNFMNSVFKILKGGLVAFKVFPASISCALAFAIVTLIRIQIDWGIQEPMNFLFNCLSWSLALGAIFGLAAITVAQSWHNEKRMFRIANILTIVVAVVAGLLLFFFGGVPVSRIGSNYTVISSLSIARISVALIISFILFIIAASHSQEKSDCSQSFFMVQKAAFIALLYGVVMIAGVSGVVGAIQVLLYPQMSGKVYQYMITISGFLAFTIFVGYFPDFRKGEVDPHREIAENQPKFIRILFEYIMIPIMIALTLVLLLWSGKTIMDGMKVSFVQLSGIATAYAIFGLWLHVMVTHYNTGLAAFYRKAYPISAVVILAIEAWALIIQLLKSNLKTTEYMFIVIWIIALVAAILLFFFKEKSHKTIAIFICVMAVITVLPAIGYRDLPVTMQVNRLKQLLNSEDMIIDNQLIATDQELELEVRESISDAVNYLVYVQNAKLPTWFDPRLDDYAVFEQEFGFKPVSLLPDTIGNEDYLNTVLVLPSEALDISDYTWVVQLEQENTESASYVTGDRGNYEFDWTVDQSQGIPTLKVLLNDKVIIEQSMENYLDNMARLYLP